MDWDDRNPCTNPCQNCQKKELTSSLSHVRKIVKRLYPRVRPTMGRWFTCARIIAFRHSLHLTTRYMFIFIMTKNQTQRDGTLTTSCVLACLSSLWLPVKK